MCSSDLGESAPDVGNRTFMITAEIERPAAGSQGCILSFGDIKSGFALYILGDRLLCDYNLFGTHYKAASSIPVPTGRCSVGMDLVRKGNEGHIALKINGASCGSVVVPQLLRRLWRGGLNLGRNDGTPVSADYVPPFPFEGTLHLLTLDVPPAKATPQDQRQRARADLAEQ